MQITRGFHHLASPGPAPLTIGNFDGVQPMGTFVAMLALLNSEALQSRRAELRDDFRAASALLLRGFAAQAGSAPAWVSDAARQADRTGALRSRPKCRAEIRRTFSCPSLVPEAFIDSVLVQALGVKYVLVGDDFGSAPTARATTPCLDAAGSSKGLDVARTAIRCTGLRVSSSAGPAGAGPGPDGRRDGAASAVYSISGQCSPRPGKSWGASSASGR
jgi:riboflavin kinase/FMN adenylyltransferase